MTRAAHIYQARVYLAQARATPHHTFRIILQNWAAKRRMQAIQVGQQRQLALL
jgi:hypothetical protein